MTSAETFDYIVVGAGSSGCVLARRLSEARDGRVDPHASVLLVEAGAADTDDNIHHSYVPNLFALWQSPLYTRQYAVERRPGAGTAWPSIARGVGRGGSSAINGMIYVRGNARDYDGWAREAKAAGWGYRDVLPYFKKSEDFEGGESEFHGVGGPLHVRRLVDPTPVAHAFTHAAAALGRFQGPDWDFNAGRQEDGAGLYQVTVTQDGRRASAAVAFLNPLRDTQAKLNERTGTLVSRILLENGRAVGVECLNLATRQPEIYRAEREVIICAGTFESPKLLMLSGIGPAETLRGHGIEVQVALPGVGQNLHDHLMLLMYYESKTNLPEPKFIAEAGLFTRTPTQSSTEPPALQYHFCAGMNALTPPGWPANFLFCPVLVRPKSRGHVTLLSNDPRHPPRIDPAYLQVDDDVKVLRYGIELARELADAKPFGDFRGRGKDKGKELLPSALFGSDENFIRATATTVWHPVGTCKMAADSDPAGVVDGTLKVRGVEGLRVADASVMPTITSGNTNAACIMIAEKAADLIRDAC